MPRNRSAAERHGRGSETLAAWALRLKGYRILGTRMKTRLGEIDFIALAPLGPVCFVEVKARAGTLAAALSVTDSQRARIRRAADLYLAARPKLRTRGMRFDIVAVAPGRWPVHHKDCWRADDV